MTRWILIFYNSLKAKLKITNGKILIIFGIIHTLFSISPIAFGKQFKGFAKSYFFRISDGALELPIFNGHLNFEDFSAFWFFYFGLLLLPFGILLNHVENNNLTPPKPFIWSYFFVVALGVYMFPFSGITVFMLPHAFYMLLNTKKEK